MSTAPRWSALFFGSDRFSCQVLDVLLEARQMPPLHALNVHPSLLPRYRGAAPIQWAIANNDSETGVTIQELSKGAFDRGKILAQQTAPIPQDASYADLESMLSRQGGLMLRELLQDFEPAKKNAWSQEGPATKAPKISRQTARIDWAKWTAADVVRRQRAFGHQARLWTTYQDEQVHLYDLSVADTAWTGTAGSPGLASFYNDCVYIQCADGLLKAQRLRSRARLADAREWWNGEASSDAMPAYVVPACPLLTASLAMLEPCQPSYFTAYNCLLPHCQTMVTIPFSDPLRFQWLKADSPLLEELKFEDQGQTLKLRVPPGCDYWRKPGHDVQNGHAFVLDAGTTTDWKASVGLQGRYVNQYDQATIFLWLKDTNGHISWAKAGPERDDDANWIGSVVTTQYSDWSICLPPPDQPQITDDSIVRFSLERQGHLLAIRATYDSPSQGLPIYRRDVNGFFAGAAEIAEVKVGIMACQPNARSSPFEATFRDFQLVFNR